MKETLVGTRNISPDHVAVIQDWIDEDEFRPVVRENEWRRAMGLKPESFVALYAGTLGIVSGADVLVETAEALKDCPDTLLLCVGEGVLKERMAMTAARRSLPNIRFEPFQDRKQVPEMHAAADVCVLTMKSGLSNASVPSKLITYMAAGRPVICAAPSETDVARVVLRANAGRVVRPGDSTALAQAIRELQANPEMAREMGANARRYFQRELAFRHRYEEFISVIRQAVARRGPGSTRLQSDGNRTGSIVSVQGGVQ